MSSRLALKFSRVWWVMAWWCTLAILCAKEILTFWTRICRSVIYGLKSFATSCPWVHRCYKSHFTVRFTNSLGLLDDKRSTIRTWRPVSVNNMDEDAHNNIIICYFSLHFRTKIPDGDWEQTPITLLTMGGIWQMWVITVKFAAIKLVFLSHFARNKYLLTRIMKPVD